MPRTFKATVALITTLIVIGLLTILNVWQTHNTEKQLLSLQREIQKLDASTRDIEDKIASGAISAGSGRGEFAGTEDPYDKYLDEPDNLLGRESRDLIPDDAVQGGTLRRDTLTDPKGFNFITENSVVVSNLQGLIHNGFAGTDFEDPARYIPDLAYKITANDDYTVYTIHLKEGVYWHPLPHPDIGSEEMEWAREKHEVTAEDAAFYFELIKNPQVEAGALKSYYEDLDRVEVVDTHTLKVYWKKKTYQSKSFTMGVFPMPKWLFTREKDGSLIPEETLGKSFNNHWASNYPIGTGPYKFVKYEKGQRIVLERNEDYFDEKPPIERIEYKILRDPSHRLRELKKGQLDFLEEVPPATYKTEILEDKNSMFNKDLLEHRIVDRFAYYYIGWNSDNPLFQQKKVRHALTHAFNRKDIIERVFQGLGVIQSGPYYYEHPANDPDVDPLAFDLDKASEMLDESGWKDTDGDGVRDKVINGNKTDLAFTILSYGHRPEFQTALSIYKEDLRKLGVSMDYSPVDWPTMLKKMDEKKFDAYTGGWGLSWTIDPYQIWHSSQADVPKGSNRVGFRHERADEIIEEMRVTFDEDKRVELAREFHRIVHEEQPYTFFFAPKNVIAYNPRLQHVLVRKTRPQFSPIPWYIDPSKTPEELKK